ncbi:MAG: hypothetical protein AAF585_00560 [Verrucomicrobiota bacterium]
MKSEQILFIVAAVTLLLTHACTFAGEPSINSQVVWPVGPGLRNFITTIDLNGYRGDVAVNVKYAKNRSDLDREGVYSWGSARIGNDPDRPGLVKEAHFTFPFTGNFTPNSRDVRSQVIDGDTMFHVEIALRYGDDLRQRRTKRFIGRLPRDLTVVYLGDSFGAGTGAKHYDLNRDYYRSSRAGQHQAVLDVFSGNRSYQFLNATYEGARLGRGISNRGKDNRPAQLQMMFDWQEEIGIDEVDIMMLNIGGNDLGFANIIEEAVISTFEDIQDDEDLHRELARDFVTLRQLYGEFDNLLGELPGGRPQKVIINTYPDPTKNEDAEYEYESFITAAEYRWAFNNLVVPMNNLIREQPWITVDVQNRSRRHGYGADDPWFHSLWDDADLTEVFHPNPKGWREIYTQPVTDVLYRNRRVVGEYVENKQTKTGTFRNLFIGVDLSNLNLRPKGRLVRLPNDLTNRLTLNLEKSADLKTSMEKMQRLDDQMGRAQRLVIQRKLNNPAALEQRIKELKSKSPQLKNLNIDAYQKHLRQQLPAKAINLDLNLENRPQIRLIPNR